MTADDLLSRLARAEPHMVRAWVVTVTAVDQATGTCTIDPADGDVVTEVPYWGGPPGVGSVQVAFLFDSLMGVLTGARPVTDTGWVNLTPVVGTGTLAYRCADDVVALKGSLSGLSVAAGASQNIVPAGVLPAAYRPSTSVYAVSNGGAAIMCTASVGTDGSIGMWNSHPSAVVGVFRCNFTWLKE